MIFGINDPVSKRVLALRQEYLQRWWRSSSFFTGSSAEIFLCSAFLGVLGMVWTLAGYNNKMSYRRKISELDQQIAEVREKIVQAKEAG